MDDKVKAGKKLGTADIATVMKLLPHRYPFLLVDRMYDMDADESCVGVKNVTINEPFFQGHFPQFPVMPGVLIIEGLAQTAGALCVSTSARIIAPSSFISWASITPSSASPCCPAISFTTTFARSATAAASGASEAKRR